MTIQGETYLGGFTETCFQGAFQRFKGTILLSRLAVLR